MSTPQHFQYLENKDKIFPLAEKIFVQYFDNNEKKFEEFFDNLNDINKDKFLKISFFYYHHWWKFDNKLKEENNSFCLIIISSMIEATVSEAGYEDFYSWYQSKYRNKNGNKNWLVEELWNEYISQYGCAKKVIYFFENYLSKKDKKKLIRKFSCI